MPITTPRDLGAELAEAARWYAGEAEMEAFLDHIRAGHSWSERRPRQLLSWANQRGVPVFGHKRFVLVMNAGFDCPERWRLWRVAKAELRRVRAAIARGEEAGMIYSGGRDLLAFGESGPRRWGAPESALRPSAHPSLAGPPPEMPGATAPSPPSSSGPQLPRGGWLTRG
jgi:hypothetical protein